MATQAGVGYSESPNSYAAGAEAARAAMEKSGVDRADLAILFSTAKHDPERLRDGVRSVIGPDTRMIGGAAVGVITNDQLGYEGLQVGVAVLSSDRFRIDLFRERGLAQGEEVTGKALGRKIRSKTYEGSENLILMFDLIRSAREGGGMNMNVPSSLLRGLGEGIGTWPSTAGLGLQGGFQFHPGFHWFDDETEGAVLESQSALALMFSGDVQMDTITMHGCRPSSDYHTVTEADGNVLLKLDGEPAIEVVRRILGDESDVPWEEFPPYITLGISKADRFKPFDEGDYSVRVCLALDQDRGGLVMGSDDLVPGTEVQFMYRRIDFDDVHRRTRSLVERLDGRHPFFALYIDCAGRTAAVCGTDREEAEEVQRALDTIPMLGMYGGVEIASVGAEIVQNNMTGVVCLFSEPVSRPA
jgi:hypothetical protein